VEGIDFRALGGSDNVVVGDLSGTDVTEIEVDLGVGGAGDGAGDSITVNGTNGADTFGAVGDAGGVSVFGLQAKVDVFFAEQANDRLTLNALGDNDVVDATSLEADAIQLTINGGLGNDVLIGGEGGDQFNGGDGADLMLMGAGDDSFVWNPGDDNDTLEGQSGFDTMLFNGANVAEQINVQANGGRILFTRDVASVVMDLNDVEHIEFAARGGADTITVHDLSGTDATDVDVNLESAPGSGVGDAQPDNVIVNGTSGDDAVIVVGAAGSTEVLGLPAAVAIAGSESALDRVRVNALAGDDVVDATGLSALSIQLTADGGANNDILLGGDGADVLLGGDGDDVLIGGPGVDVLDGGPGNNTIIQ
jgi:Ca2+-binding RTX toxin-like protein